MSITTQFNSIVDFWANQWYKPYDIGMFSGKIYSTKDGIYIIDEFGVLHTESSSGVDGCRVSAVAGIDQHSYNGATNMVKPGTNSTDFIRLLANVGRKPKEGLCLAVAISLDDSQERRVAGLLGGRIVNVTKIRGMHN